VTIADLVADLRAATPSEAAEKAVPDAVGLASRVGSLRSRIANYTAFRLEALSARVRELSGSRYLADPLAFFLDKLQYIDDLSVAAGRAAALFVERTEQRVGKAVAALNMRSPMLIERAKERFEKAAEKLRVIAPICVERARRRFEQATAKLHILSPLASLSRGYSITMKLSDNTVLTRVQDAAPGDRLRIRLADGELPARVEE